MNKNKLDSIELFLSILILIGIVFLIVNPYFIFKGWLKSVLYINDNNRTVVESLIKESKYYGSEIYNGLVNINDLKKIQFYQAFNNFEFTLYYKDGSTEKLGDDDLINLQQYIEKNGYSKAELYIMLGVGVLVICIILNEKRKEISNQIEWIYKQQERDEI